jgi:hypothetical protein
MKKLQYVAALILLSSGPATAQQAADKSQGIAALVGVSPEMERLAPMEGTWKVDVELYRPKLQRWDKGEGFTAYFSRKYGGHFIETELVSATGTQGYVAQVAFSYDKYRKRYRAFFRDSIFGLLDIFEGNFEGNRLLIDNRVTGTAGPPMNGNLEPNRLAMKFETPNRFTLDVQRWGNEQWVDGMRYSFSRLTATGE